MKAKNLVGRGRLHMGQNTELGFPAHSVFFY